MAGWNSVLGLITWLISTGGGAMSLVGIVFFFLSFGDNGSGDQRRSGILLFIGGVAIIAAAQLVPVFFTAPPTI